ncbi:hypothetical protein ACQKP0_22105 [Heyndrickxia sp. NPDC080065]|uniref:hypothetical protein n=1 Tax=Heyndrickxia sp. NPDC080065 TaxID=3390568 RepID=UPI003D02B949
MKKYFVSAKPLKTQSYNVIKEAIIKGVLSDNEALTEKKRWSYLVLVELLLGKQFKD